MNNIWAMIFTIAILSEAFSAETWKSNGYVILFVCFKELPLGHFFENTL